MEEEVQCFLDPWKESKNLTFEKKVEKVVFMRGYYEGYELSHVAPYDTKYLKKVLKMLSLEKKTKDLIKQALARTQPFLTLCINHAAINPTTKLGPMYVQPQTQRPYLKNLERSQQHFPP